VSAAGDPVLAINGELVHVGVVVGGAVDYTLGRPLNANPYAPDFQPCHAAWALGWQQAQQLFPRERLLEQFVKTWMRWPASQRWAA
jgi:hypothetical protein